MDCNSCYASCEQIFRPDLRGRPVVVLSNNDGFLVARSKEAKLLGIGDLEPFFKVQHLLRAHRVAIFSSNYPLYGDISHRVMTTLREFGPNVEVYSIDEMFLDLHGCRRIGRTTAARSATPCGAISVCLSVWVSPPVKPWPSSPTVRPRKSPSAMVSVRWTRRRSGNGCSVAPPSMMCGA
ncbi:hypothetical protein ACJJI4_23810 (plasmid) [Microbulbifer sp. TRSA002]|uniref:Y-family DNA polymerase n=1 Tax=Microbulbifer sp. TRSA002 TaxID=3243382 RepID=UPI004039F675